MSCNWGTSEAAEPARTQPGALMSPLFCSAEDRDSDGQTGRQKDRRRQTKTEAKLRVGEVKQTELSPVSHHRSYLN